MLADPLATEPATLLDVVRFQAFRGLRYGVEALAAKGLSFDQVIAPPYDVIEPEERERLVARSQYNAVRVELPTAAQGGGLDPYGAAASLLAAWQTEGVLTRDPRPALYGYQMAFRDDQGLSRRLTGVIGALHLEAFDQGQILPHERTLPKPLGDRFELLRACRVNTSPVWGLSAATGLSALVGQPESAPAVDGRSGGTLSATDDGGVLHQLWPITEDQVVDAISAAVASCPLVIADGHHRYETALAFEAAAAEAPDRPPGVGSIMALVVELSDDQLWVQPIHRVLEGVPPTFDLLGALSSVVSLEVLAERLPADGLLRPVDAPLLLAPEGVFALRAPSGDEPADLDADSSRLERALGTLGSFEVSYTPDANVVAGAVRQGRARAGFLLRPVTVGQIAEAARTHRRFPPKTSFFSPKPRTGMVFRPLFG